MRLGVLLTTLRRHGVAEYQSGTTRIVLGPLPERPAKQKDKPDSQQREQEPPLPQDAATLSLKLRSLP